jgi:hypothetical protein
MHKLGILALAFYGYAIAQSPTNVNGNRTFTANVDLSTSTLLKLRQGNALPSTCSYGETFQSTASIPFIAYDCTATNTWTGRGNIAATAGQVLFSGVGNIVSGSSLLTWDPVNNYLTATTTPGYSHVFGSPQLYQHSTGNNYSTLVVGRSFLGTDAGVQKFAVSAQVDFTGAADSSPFINVGAVSGSAVTEPASSGNLLRNRTDLPGLSGGSFTFNHYGSGTVATGAGVYSEVYQSPTSGGPITWATAYWAGQPEPFGNWTNYAALYDLGGVVQLGSGVITNRYGVYIASLAGSGATNKWAWYSVDSPSYFGGGITLPATASWQTPNIIFQEDPSGRGMFTSTQTNFSTTITVVPTGNSTGTSLNVRNSSDTANYSRLGFGVTGGVGAISVVKSGTGTPITDVNLQFNNSGTVYNALDLSQNGLMLGDNTQSGYPSQPACSSTTRRLIWYTTSGSGTKDAALICAKDASDAYAWRVLY